MHHSYGHGHGHDDSDKLVTVMKSRSYYITHDCVRINS